MPLNALAKPRASKPRVATGTSIPAPVGGWDTISPMAAMPEDRAILLDNWFPQPGYIELRAGHKQHCATGVSTVVNTLMPYHAQNASNDKLYAASGTVIYDVTTSTPSSSVTTLTNSKWQYVNFTTSGGHYLWCCNGADSSRHYNGTSWATPTITGITSSNIINVAVHKNRLWFVQINSTQAAYLPPDCVQGAATTFELGGVFKLGGSLMAIGSWSLDGGSGPQDYIAFISSKGEVAVYSGADPSSADTWSLQGLFTVGPPIGRRCLTRVGADLAFISIDGVVPLSRALIIDRGVVVKVALTANIQPTMNAAARNYASNYGWQLVSYPKGTRAILNVPCVEGNTQHQYVMNTVTGAWCRFTGQNANCWEVWKDRLFFGGNDGKVYEADTTGADAGVAIVADMKTAFNYYGARGNSKRFIMCRPILTTDGTVQVGMALNTDFSDTAQPETASSTLEAAALWDSAVWDAATWPSEDRTLADWQTVNGIGFCASLRVKIQQSASAAPTLRINGFDMLYELGAPI